MAVHNISSDRRTWLLDREFETLPLPGIQKGMNRILLSCAYRNDSELENIYLAGSFGVTEDRRQWSEPEDSGNAGGNHSPYRLHSGRLSCPGGTEHGITDDPAGIDGWRTVRCCEEGYPGNQNAEDGEGTTAAGIVNDHTVYLCEASCIQQKDGTVWVMMRSGTPYLWASKSTDDGENWTLPEPTCFTDNRTKSAFGRLSGGKYYYVGTPDPFPPRTRHVLALSLSDNGTDYNQHLILDDRQYKGRYVGLDKNGIYGYRPYLSGKDICMLYFPFAKRRLSPCVFPAKRCRKGSTYFHE